MDYKALNKNLGRIFPSRLFACDCEDVDTDILFDTTDLQKILEKHEVPAEKQEKLLDSLKRINEKRDLCELSHAAARGFVKALADGTAGELDAPEPECLEGFDREAFPFLFALCLAKTGKAEMKRRGIPEEYYTGNPEYPTRRILRKYKKRDSLKFSDYQWDANYFGCGIFRLGRFLFIPYEWEDTPYVFRKNDGEVLALWENGAKVRTDGQLDGVNGIKDENAFTTVFCETDEAFTGNPVDRRGFILQEKVELKKSDWQQVLHPGDKILALHIPDGEGYDPEHLHESIRMAFDFFGKYYPEYNFKAIQSESWLFDRGIAELLGPDRRISRVMNEFYCYPTHEGDRMTIDEVFHTDSKEFSSFPEETTLQRIMKKELLNGNRFHTSGAFILRAEK